MGVIGFKFGPQFLIGAQVEGFERVQKKNGAKFKRKTPKMNPKCENVLVFVGPKGLL